MLSKASLNNILKNIKFTNSIRCIASSVVPETSTPKRQTTDEKYQELKKMSTRPLYLDSLATTPLDPRVLDTMMPYLTTFYGDPHSQI